MENIVISSDSGLNPIDKKYMIPGLIVDRKGNTFYDQISLEKDTKVLSMEEMFRNMESGEVYQTSAPKYIVYLNTFEKLLQAKKEVLHLTISEYVSSSSYNISMKLIKELQEKYQGKIEIVDSKTAGSGGTILTSYAQELLKEKMSLLEMKEKLEIVRNKVIGSHFVSSCKGYVRSGRVPDSFTLADFLGLRYRVDSNKEGKLAITEYKRIKHNNDFSLLEINIKTGRRNQIRVQLKEIGHPIVGDSKYGFKNKNYKRMLLHASKLEIINPMNGKNLSFESKIDSSFKSIFN